MKIIAKKEHNSKLPTNLEKIMNFMRFYDIIAGKEVHANAAWRTDYEKSIS